jgi:hypothetical protein
MLPQTAPLIDTHTDRMSRAVAGPALRVRLPPDMAPPPWRPAGDPH